jgi:transposase
MFVSKPGSFSSFSVRLLFPISFSMINRRENVQQARLLAKKRHLPYTDLGERRAMQAIYNSGVSKAKVAKLLGCSLSTVKRVLRSFNLTGSFLPKPKSGRPRKVSPEKEGELVRLSEENRKRTSAELNSILKQQDASFAVSNCRISYYLRKNGLLGRVCSRKPLLRPANKAARLAFALEHKDKPLEFWMKTLWTDEKKFELFNSKRRQYCRRKQGESLRDDTIQPTVKHGGGSVMFWGCFMAGRTGDLHRIEGIMKKEQYHSILSHHAIPSGVRLAGGNFVFQEDNDPKHSSHLCRNYLQRKEDQGVLVRLVWPSQSPDLNPIELVWEEMDRRVRKEKPTNENELIRIINQVWENMPQETLIKLVERIPRLLQAVIEAEGGYFDEKYAPRKFKNQLVYHN